MRISRGAVRPETDRLSYPLADGFGSLEYVAREVIKAEDIRDYTISEGIAEKFARRFGAGVAAAVMKWAVRAAPVIR